MITISHGSSSIESGGMEAQRFLYLALLSLVFFLTGCGGLNTLSAARAYEKDFKMGAETMVFTPAPKRDLSATDGAKKFALMALFSQMAYLDHLSYEDRNDADCQKRISEHPINQIDNRDPSKTPAWRRWDDKLGCHSESGLYYEVYVFGKTEAYEEAVIAFRGTENYPAQRFLDWSANLDDALGLDPVEYKIARDEIGKTIAELRRQYPSMPIYLTGHSLGGGLAQQSAYTSTTADVKATYVFNTSAVTNWSYLYLKPGSIKTSAPIIRRISERGEILGDMRWVTSRVNFRRFGRSDYEFNFSQGNAASSHSMAILACNLASRVLADGHEARHHFTSDMAIKLLEQNVKSEHKEVQRLCPDGVWGLTDRTLLLKLAKQHLVD